MVTGGIGNISYLGPRISVTERILVQTTQPSSTEQKDCDRKKAPFYSVEDSTSLV